jgi:DNA (cytosine-5)-methyltransferase 1
MVNELSLFTGYGGFSLGLRLAGLQTRTVMYVEWERYPQEVIKARIKDGYLDDAPIWGDISTLDGQQLRGVVDIITAGFPCQPHSVAGLKQGADDERNFWPETLRIIREVGPRYVLLENVPGLLSASSDGGTPAYGGTVVGELAQIGYSVHWRTIGADDVGAPHRRKRWWCIGVADSDKRSRIQRKLTARSGNAVWHSGQLADSRQQPAGAEGRGLDGGWEDAGSEARVRTTEGNRFADGNNALDDSQYDGQPRSQDPSGVGSQVHPQAGAVQPEQLTGSGISATGGEELGDTNINAVQGMEQGTQQSEYQRQVGLPSGEASIPTWPPSPSDADGWAGLLAERPDLAPALTKETESQFRRVDHGRSHRVDELKALGNGIVPAVVAEFLWGLMEEV